MFVFALGAGDFGAGPGHRRLVVLGVYAKQHLAFLEESPRGQRRRNPDHRSRDFGHECAFGSRSDRALAADPEGDVPGMAFNHAHSGKDSLGHDVLDLRRRSDQAQAAQGGQE